MENIENSIELIKLQCRTTLPIYLSLVGSCRKRTPADIRSIRTFIRRWSEFSFRRQERVLQSFRTFSGRRPFVSTNQSMANFPFQRILFADDLFATEFAMVFGLSEPYSVADS